MERRALLAAVLCLIVLVGYQEALQYLYPAQQNDSSTAKIEAHPLAPPGEAPSEVSPEAEHGGATSAPNHPLPSTEPILIETDLYSARVEPVGGRISSLRLKGYRTSISKDSQPLEMIQLESQSAAPLGVRLVSDDGKIVEDDTRVVYRSDRAEIAVRGTESAQIVLRGTLPSGAAIEKRLTFTGASFPIDVEIQTAGAPGHFNKVGLGWRHQIVAPMPGDPEAHYRGTLVLADKKVVRDLATAIATSPAKPFPAPVGWVGYADHYFLAAMIPADPAESTATVSPETNGVQLLVTSALGSDQTARFTLYVGPKDVAVLETVGHRLERAVDFGWFSFLAIPLLRLLKIFHSITGNYGVDVILLTILIKALFIPLTNRSMKSMRDMQRLQPQMAKLREKFKDDRERLNKEMIELYRRHRVNPLGGCLPMLLQFPVFIGLYQALSQAIELRHARFGFWVHDLSAHECYPWPGQGTISGCNEFAMLGFPIPILVLLMGGSMILQQYLSPSSGMDPAQQRMMMVLMPVMFTVMFINFPSGLVLYWLVNNVLTIAQQWWANRDPAPAASSA